MYGELCVSLQMFEVGRVPIGEIIDYCYGMTIANKPVHQVAADKACPASDYSSQLGYFLQEAPVVLCKDVSLSRLIHLETLVLF